MKRTTVCLFFVGMIAAPSPAWSVPVSLNYDFIASGFRVAAPLATIVGAFAVTFDNAADILDSPTGITGTATLQLTSPLVFSYFAALDRMAIGGAAIGAGGISVDTGVVDWRLLIDNVSASPTFLQFHYAPGDREFYVGNVGSLTPSTPVAEPGALPLMGLVGLTALAWTRRRAAPAACPRRSATD